MVNSLPAGNRTASEVTKNAFYCQLLVAFLLIFVLCGEYQLIFNCLLLTGFGLFKMVNFFVVDFMTLKR